MNRYGFHLNEGVINEYKEQWFIERIIAAIGKTRIKRDEQDRSRILRFGYDYTDKDVWLGEPPDWVYDTVGRYGDSVTINEYGPGHGIRPHIDSLKFQDEIRILNLGSHTTMQLISPQKQTTDEFIPRRSMTILYGEVRRTWKHGIESRAFDMTPEGIREDRGTRYSIVYRQRRPVLGMMIFNKPTTSTETRLTP